MIDKILISVLDEKRINEIIIPKLIGNKSFTSENHGSTSHVGQFKNFRIDKKGAHLRFSGSLAKYVFTENCFNGNLATIRKAIQSFCVETGVCDDAIISHLEFGFNIPLACNVGNYLRLLKYASGYNTQVFHSNKEVVFQQEEKKIRLYDKTNDFNANQYQIRLDNQKKVNLLRYEIVLNYPKRVLKITDSLKLADLGSTEIYSKLINLWVDEFKRIKTDSLLRYDFPFNSISAITKRLILLGVENSGGLTEMLKLADTIQFEKSIPQNKRRLKIFLENACRDGSFNRKNDLIEELQSKVMATAMAHYSF